MDDFHVTQYEATYTRTLTMLFIVGLTGLSLPVILLGMPRFVKGVSMAIGVLNFGAGAVMALEYPTRSKLARGREMALLEQQQQAIVAQASIRSSMAQVYSEWGLAHQIYTSAPAGMGLFYMQQMGLGHFASYYYRDQVEGVPGPASAATTVEAQKAPRQMAPLGFEATRDDIDVSWLTPEFARRSKIVAAARGSGKSCYLYWEANTVVENSRNGERLVIIDGHLIARQIKAAAQAQLPPGSRLPVWGIHQTAEEEAKFVIHDPTISEMTCNSLRKEVMNRLQGKVADMTPIKIIIDEADGQFFVSPEHAANGAAMVELFRIIINESRKVDVEVTIAQHTFKKGRTGIDSADGEQVSWLIMGNMLAAANIKFPTDLDTSRWCAERNQLQSTLTDEIGRAVVIRDEHEGATSIRVAVMPRMMTQVVPTTQVDSDDAE
jgi:hypothetical protein